VTSKEIEELAGHRPVSAWVFKLVGDAIAIEREACANACNKINVFGMHQKLQTVVIEDCVAAIRARGQE
jgi:hypothetical protein